MTATPPRRPPVVLHVLEALEGGTARHLVDLVGHAEAVHHVAIPHERVGWVTPRTAVQDLETAGATVHFVAMRRSPTSFRNLRAIAAIRSLASRIRPDVVHGHSSIGGVVARVATRSAPVARLYTPNGIAPGRLAVTVERYLGRRTTRLIAVSNSERDLAERLRLVPPERLVVVPNGISPDAPPTSIDLRAEIGIPQDTPLVGTVARLVPQKAPLDFVRTAALVAEQIPDAHFVHIGSGPMLGAIQRAMDRLALVDRFHVVPFLDGVGAALGQLDVFVLTSQFEGGPYTPLEAMRGGTPVVLSDAVGNRDVVEHGISGFVVPAGAIHEYAEDVVKLLRNPEDRDRIVAAGRERVRTDYDVRNMGDAMTALYREVVGTPP